MADIFTCDTPTAGKAIECYTCGKRPFESMRALRKHWVDDHNSSARVVTAKDRPDNRGKHACGFPGCGRSFKYSFGRISHRKQAHGIDP